MSRDWVAGVTKNGDKFVYDRKGGMNYFEYDKIDRKLSKRYVALVFGSPVVLISVLVISVLFVPHTFLSKEIVVPFVITFFAIAIVVAYFTVSRPLKLAMDENYRNNHYVLNDNVELWSQIKAGKFDEFTDGFVLNGSNTKSLVPVRHLVDLIASVGEDAKNRVAAVDLVKWVLSNPPKNALERSSLISKIVEIA